MAAAELTRRIAERAATLGFDAVGVAPATSLSPERLQEWLGRDYHGRMGYLERQFSKRLNPELILPGARSIVCFAMNYLHRYELPYEDASRAVFSRYASGDDYHDLLQERLGTLYQELQKSVPGLQGRYYVDTGPVQEKEWAERAGLGWIGKHTNLIAGKRLGSWFFLGELLLNVELDYDRPATDHCGSCRACIDACPTDAIVEPYLLDSRLCISYLTIELKEDIPWELRPGISNLVYGCDICQDVCPWNRKAVETDEPAFAPRATLAAPRLRELATLSREEFSRLFKGSPVKRTKWRGLMRNTAVAMGNSGDSAMVPELKRLLNCDEPLVRRHAAWALHQIGGSEAGSALQQRSTIETDPATLDVLHQLREMAPRSTASKGQCQE